MGNSPYYTAIKANDAYYYLDNAHGNTRMYRVPSAEHEDPIRVPLSASVAHGLAAHEPAAYKLVNYDADWLYLKGDNNLSLFRIRKDGTEYQESVAGNKDRREFLDIVDGWVFYVGADGILYKEAFTGTGEPEPMSK
jgi:hypothetical protein